MHWNITDFEKNFFFQTFLDFSDEIEIFIKELSSCENITKVRWNQSLDQFFFVEQKENMVFLKPLRLSFKDLKIKPGVRESQARSVQHQHHSHDILSPMTGVILSMSVLSGQPVKKGDCILYIEAMKMENPILATKNGIFSFKSNFTIGSKISAGDLIGVIDIEK